MKPSFSFLYQNEERRYTNAGVYELADGITVTAIQSAYETFDATEWVLYFENKSDKNSGIFSSILDCDTLLPLPLPPAPKSGYSPLPGDACVITMTGCVPGELYIDHDKSSAEEFGFSLEYLDKAPGMTKRFMNYGGRSSDRMMPFFDVTAGGEGYMAAIGWTGDWQAEFTRAAGGIHIKTGLQSTHFYLKPGERLRTSSILLMKYGANEDKHNKLRRLIKQHFSHVSHTNATREGLMAFELWGGLPSEEMKKRIDRLMAHEIHFADIWIDAGWYGNCTKCDETFSGDWSQKTGDWYPNPRVHPGGLADVAAHAREAGAGMMLWIEPERAVEGTEMTLAHPTWFMTRPGDRSLILNLGNEEAWQYVYDLVAGYVKKLGFTCFRQDSNADLTDYFANADEEDRRGITEIKHIMGLYRLWDALTTKFPHLLIDNCASGGRRIDIEALRRTVLFFRSDYQCNFNANPEVLQVHNANLSCYLPYSGCTSKTKNDTYAIRSSYSASWGGAFYNAVFQEMDEGDMAWVKQITEEYRRIRHYFSMDFYNHGSAVFDVTSWAVWQYHDPDTQSGILMAFRRSESPFDTVGISLRGLSEGKQYRFTSLDDGAAFDGGAQMQIVLKEKRSCVIFEYKAI